MMSVYVCRRGNVNVQNMVKYVGNYSMVQLSGGRGSSIQEDCTACIARWTNNVN